MGCGPIWIGATSRPPEFRLISAACWLGSNAHPRRCDREMTLVELVSESDGCFRQQSYRVQHDPDAPSVGACLIPLAQHNEHPKPLSHSASAISASEPSLLCTDECSEYICFPPDQSGKLRSIAS